MSIDAKKLPIDARVIGINGTKHWRIDPEDAPLVKEIRSVYWYDRNTHAHLCSFTPTYYLHALYRTVLLTELGENLRDRDEGAIDELRGRYEDEEITSDYYDCKGIDARSDKWHVPHGVIEVDRHDEDAMRDAEESISEQLRCNHKL